MKFFRILTVLAIVACTRLSFAQMDTVFLLGGTASFEIGWYGEAFKNGNWCNDVLVPDAHPDTTITIDTIKNNNLHLNPVFDTVMASEPSKAIMDSLHVVTTTTVTTRTVLRKALTDSIVDVINATKTIVDSSVVNVCDKQFRDFIADAGGFFQGASYVNYYYKKRNYWATLPVVWNGWGGIDSLTVAGAKSLVIIYQGVLPGQQLKLEFRYASWGSNKPEVDKMALHMGDGVGFLAPSTTWKTVVLPIPDSVSLPGITGLDFAIDGGGKTSELGNIKIALIALLKPSQTGVRSAAARHGMVNDRLHFTPKNAGTVMVSLYSLEGRLVCAKAVSVIPARQYSVRGLATKLGGASAAQIRIVKIQGAGVDVNEKIW